MKQPEDTRTLDMHDPGAGAVACDYVINPNSRKAAGYRSISLDPNALNVLEAVMEQLHLRKGLRLNRAQAVGYVLYEYRRLLTTPGAK